MLDPKHQLRVENLRRLLGRFSKEDLPFAAELIAAAFACWNDCYTVQDGEYNYFWQDEGCRYDLETLLADSFWGTVLQVVDGSKEDYR